MTVLKQLRSLTTRQIRRQLVAGEIVNEFLAVFGKI